MIKTRCRCCDSQGISVVVDLGDSPLANNLLNDISSKDDLFPLKVMYCDNCHNCQLSCVVPPEKMFDTYLYVSSTTKTLRDHFDLAAKSYIKEFGLNEKSTVVDIGSNDGVGLIPYMKHGIRVLGIEPASNICKISEEKGIETINSYFNDSSADQVIERAGKVDLVTASNVFAHSDFVKEITKNVFKMLKEDGCFIVEVQYLLDTIKDMTFDNIYHEHVNYWSVTSLNQFFERLGYCLVKVEHIDTHGGSIRAFVKNSGSEVDRSVSEYLLKEEQYGLTNKSTYENFFERIKKIKENVIFNLETLKRRNFRIAGYGSPAKATTALNYFGVGTNYIDYVIEDNSLKHGKFLPGVKIPICDKGKIEKEKPDVVVVMAWNFLSEIKKNNQDLSDRGIKFISIKELQEKINEDTLAL